MAKIPQRVRRCTTHHHACDCREWRYEQMEQALRIIKTWSSVSADQNPFLEQIRDKCNEVLNENNDQRKA